MSGGASRERRAPARRLRKIPKNSETQNQKAISLQAKAKGGNFSPSWQFDVCSDFSRHAARLMTHFMLIIPKVTPPLSGRLGPVRACTGAFEG